MANSTLSSNQDFLDVIDLDSVLKSGRGGDYYRKSKQTQTCPGTTAATTERYNISLDSVTDDELRFVTRSLITPVSFQSHGTDDRLFPPVNAPSRQRNRILPRNSEHLAQVPTFRSESAAIFNRLADDELSVDFVTRDLSEFMDPVLLEEVISRPGSRVPRNHSNVSDSACDLSSSSAKTTPIASWIRPRTKKDQEIERPGSSAPTTAADLKLDERDQPARLISKRHSLQAEVLMALRQDSDILLQRRESLLQLRKFSEGHAPPPPPRRDTFKTERAEAAYATDLLDTLKLKKENEFVRLEPKALEKKKHTFFADECRQQRTGSTQPRLERRQSHIYEESHTRKKIMESNSLNSSDRNANSSKEPNSVTESAKNLLARVRQHRAENRPELEPPSHQQNNKRSSMRIVESKKAQPPADRPRRYISLDHYTPSTGKTKRSSSFATTTEYSSPLSSPRSTARGSSGSIQRSTSRRWSSALPLSSTKLHNAHPLLHQQDTSDRPRRTSHYLAKKSTLDKSTDRYVALLGKSRLQKE